MAKAKETVKKSSGADKQMEEVLRDIQNLKEAVAGLRARIVKQFGEG